MKKIKLKITGIHCKSCKGLIEEEVNLIAGVKDSKVNAVSGEAWVIYNEGATNKDIIIKTVESLNYEVELVKSAEIKIKKRVKSLRTNPLSHTLIFGGVVLLLVGLLYFIFSRLGFFQIMERLNDKNLSYGLIFLIGVLASFHCIGMCGGIVIAYTTRFCPAVKDNNKISFSHISYNLGRVGGYALTGAVLGGIGSFFAISKTFTGALTFLAGLFMIAVGMSFVIRLAVLDKIASVLPASFVRLFSEQIHSLKPKAPLLIGFLNGFIPCGPLQAMQIYSLASGSALAGGLSMAAFGLGTAPLMLGLGKIVSSVSHIQIKQIMKISGVIIIILGVLNINRSLGNFKSNAITQTGNNQSAEETIKKSEENNAANFQVARMDLTYQGYIPSTLTVKKGVPVRWIINVKEMSGCTNEIVMPAYNIKKKLQYGENVIEFTPKDLGEIKFSCWMKMVWGKFIVVDGDKSVSGNTPLETASAVKLPAEVSTPDSSGGQAGCGCGQKQ
ncbi:MAG: hypothetical protein FJZ04_02020 [Candidatus Moranbacteria bacterium]|nr:hypothetical protein [Candidatus Moranbacteria bacterium]